MLILYYFLATYFCIYIFNFISQDCKISNFVHQLTLRLTTIAIVIAGRAITLEHRKNETKNIKVKTLQGATEKSTIAIAILEKNTFQ